MTTNEKIQFYRKKLGLSQEELGQKLLVSRQTVSLWENGQTAPTIDNLMRLKEVFGVSIDELLGCENETEAEEKADAPQPSESYKFTLTKEDISEAYKSSVKILFKPMLKAVLMLAAALAVYVWIDAPDGLIGASAGVFGIFVIISLNQIFSYRKVWKKRTPKLEASQYEYRVFGDYFTVDLSVDGELIATEKISFTEVQKIHDVSKFLLIIINGQIYVLKKDGLMSNSAFYIAMYDNPAKADDKKAIKKLTTAANILFVLTLAVFAAFVLLIDGDFTLDYPWFFSLFLPVPIALMVLGLKLKKRGAKYLKNIIIGGVVAAMLFVDGAMSYFLSDLDYSYDPVAYFTQVTRIALPEEEIDRYTVFFEEDTQPGTGGYICSSSRIVFDDYYTEYFEDSLKHDTRWLDSFPEELSGVLSPLDFDEGHEYADKMMLYNEYTDEYNTAPEEPDVYIFMAVYYHSDENVLEIFEYEYELLSQETEKSSQEDISMTDLENALYVKVKSEISKWDEEDIYAISFFVYANEEYRYKNYSNVPQWLISYNTEADCDGAGPFDEERWNYAFWRQDTTPIIDIDNPNKFTHMLFEWYEEQGITNIGEENEDEMYDEDMNYIGKGPAGYYELLEMVANVARKLHADGVIKEQFGKDIPVIVHELEYYDLIYDATKKANPDGQADVFLKAMEMQDEAADA